jgi:ArsR family transcriptional regulator, arsenate/arsenite/antimonite-responsive transcriptional repressor
MPKRLETADAARYADMFAAMGAEPRLRIVRLLLAAHPKGLVAGEIQDELGIPASTLSHHLDKLKNEDLVSVRREGTFLWYTANADSLRAVMDFLYAECCTRSRAIEPRELVTIGPRPERRKR